MVRNRQSQDLYREMRKRLIQETEAFLDESLRHPERSVRIPTVVVGHGVFAPAFAEAFWSQVLELPDEPQAGRDEWWRRRLGA